MAGEGFEGRRRNTAVENGGYGVTHSLGGRRQALGLTQAQTKHRQTGDWGLGTHHLN